MATTRVKKVLNGLVTRDEAETAFAAFAEADAKQKKITSTMDVEMTRIRDKYATQLSNLQELRDTSFEKLQNYAENNREDFGKRKSIEFAHGILGFRTGTPKLKTAKALLGQACLNF